DSYRATRSWRSVFCTPSSHRRGTRSTTPTSRTKTSSLAFPLPLSTTKTRRYSFSTTEIFGKRVELDRLLPDPSGRIGGKHDCRGPLSPGRVRHWTRIRRFP